MPKRHKCKQPNEKHAQVSQSTANPDVLLKPKLPNSSDNLTYSRSKLLQDNIRKESNRLVFNAPVNGFLMGTLTLGFMIARQSYVSSIIVATTLGLGYGFGVTAVKSRQYIGTLKTLRDYHDQARAYTLLAKNLPYNTHDYAFQGVLAQALFSLNANNEQDANALLNLLNKIQLTPKLWQAWCWSKKPNFTDEFVRKVEVQLDKAFDKLEAQVNMLNQKQQVSDNYRMNTLAHMYNSLNTLRYHLLSQGKRSDKQPVSHNYEESPWIVNFVSSLGFNSPDEDWTVDELSKNVHKSL